MVNQEQAPTVLATRHTSTEHRINLRRWLKHLLCFKSSRRLLRPEQCQHIAAAIAAAEQGHHGEIQVVIEGSLPSMVALDSSIRQRAEALFAEYRVWDTEYNSGILLYINLCAKTIELVADRGIDGAVGNERWQQICQNMLPFFQQQQYSQGLCLGIAQIGELLTDFYAKSKLEPQGNELSNQPKLL
jgi:uncharacterized membrane protein